MSQPATRPVPDEVWYRIAPVVPRRRRILAGAGVVAGLTLATALLAGSGISRPQLSMTPVAVSLDAARGTVDLTMRLTNTGLVVAEPTLGGGRSEHGVTAVGVRAGDGSVADFLDLSAIASGGHRDVTVVLRRACPTGPDLLGAFWLVAYSPSGGSEVDAPVAAVPAREVDGLEGDRDWRAALRDVLCG